MKGQDHSACEEAEWNGIGIVSLWFELDTSHNSRFISCSLSAVAPVDAVSTRISGWVSISRYALWNNSSATTANRCIVCRGNTSVKSCFRNTVTRVIVDWWGCFETNVNLKKVSIIMLTRWWKSYLTTIKKAWDAIKCELFQFNCKIWSHIGVFRDSSYPIKIWTLGSIKCQFLLTSYQGGY